MSFALRRETNDLGPDPVGDTEIPPSAPRRVPWSPTAAAKILRIPVSRPSVIATGSEIQEKEIER